LKTVTPSNLSPSKKKVYMFSIEHKEITSETINNEILI